MEGVPPSKEFLQLILNAAERLIGTDARLGQAFEREGK
jgi:hypothetical protein